MLHMMHDQNAILRTGLSSRFAHLTLTVIYFFADVLSQMFPLRPKVKTMFLPNGNQIIQFL